eukprot:TRINITY_DN10994_c0_g1_i3.p1 TRINITY_DN10994_c0_g1~~TRINITY_DN10994_c0_g1_i3.p1  ORF type:complete len:508 (-),score=54.51 TRINITY_DN10994_c0_g1_i3:300-1772(-)
MAAINWPPRVGCRVLVQQWNEGDIIEETGKYGQWQRATVLTIDKLLFTVQYEELVEQDDSEVNAIEEVGISDLKPWCCQMEINNLTILKTGDAVLWHDREGSGWWSGVICDKNKKKVRIYFPDYDEFSDVEVGGELQLCWDYYFEKSSRVPMKNSTCKKVVQQYLAYLENVHGRKFRQFVLDRKICPRRKRQFSKKSSIINLEESYDCLQADEGEGQQMKSSLIGQDALEFESMVHVYGPIPLMEIKKALPHLTTRQIIKEWNARRGEYMDKVSNEQKVDFYSRTKRTVNFDAIYFNLKNFGYDRERLMMQFFDVKLEQLFSAVDKIQERIRKEQKIQQKNNSSSNIPTKSTPILGSTPSYRSEKTEMYFAPTSSCRPSRAKNTVGMYSSKSQKRQREVSFIEEDDVQNEPTIIEEPREFDAFQYQSEETKQFVCNIEDLEQLLSKVKRCKHDQNILSKMRSVSSAVCKAKISIQTYFEVEDVRSTLSQT